MKIIRMCNRYTREDNFKQSKAYAFIKHEKSDICEYQLFALDEVFQPPRRADHNVHLQCDASNAHM